MSKCRYELSTDCNNTDCLKCVLDKIRADIEKECKPSIYEIDFAYKKGLSRALEIIDKYRKGDKK